MGPRFLANALIASLVAMPSVPACPQETLPRAATITMPVGTVVPLTLISVIKSKSTKTGDPIRAEVAFPVTIGSQLAIPAGTYVEGKVTQLRIRDKQTHRADVEIHFDRLVYESGYTVMLDAASAQARMAAESTEGEMGMDRPLGLPDGGAIENDQELTGFGILPAWSSEEAFGVAESTPTLQPLPSVGPPKGVIIGTSVGVTAALVTLSIVFGRHRATHMDAILFDSGWQFQMALKTPLSLDPDKIASAPPQR